MPHLVHLFVKALAPAFAFFQIGVVINGQPVVAALHQSVLLCIAELRQRIRHRHAFEKVALCLQPPNNLPVVFRRECRDPRHLHPAVLQHFAVRPVGIFRHPQRIFGVLGVDIFACLWFNSVRESIAGTGSGQLEPVSRQPLMGSFFVLIYIKNFTPVYKSLWICVFSVCARNHKHV